MEGQVLGLSESPFGTEDLVAWMKSGAQGFTFSPFSTKARMRDYDLVGHGIIFVPNLKLAYIIVSTADNYVQHRMGSQGRMLSTLNVSCALLLVFLSSRILCSF